MYLLTKLCNILDEAFFYVRKFLSSADVDSHHVGCFKDSASGKFEGGYEQLPDNTPENCIEKCALKGKLLSAIHNNS